MQNLTIRPAEEYDLRAINRIIESAVLNWPAPNRLKRLAVDPLLYDHVDLQHYDVLVAEFRGEIVGVAAWDANADCTLPNGKGGLFHGLYVLPLLQQQGIGRELMNAVFERAKDQNVPGLLVKAQRVSRSYFEHQEYSALVANDSNNNGDYPWQYWKATA